MLEPLLALQQKQVAASEITTRDCELQGKADLVGCRLQSADLALFCCSDGNRRSFGDLAGLDRPQGLPPVRVDSGKGRLAFSNPQPTAFPSHAMNVSTVLPLCLLPFMPLHAENTCVFLQPLPEQHKINKFNWIPHHTSASATPCQVLTAHAKRPAMPKLHRWVLDVLRGVFWRPS